MSIAHPIPIPASPSASRALPSFDDPIHPELVQIRRLADVSQHAGKRAEIHGRYDVAPVPGGKRLQAATVVLADGKRLIRSYRPVKEELHLDAQPVVVVGRAYLDANRPGNVQQVMAPHVEVESLALHPLASPFESERDRVRTPPTLTGHQDLMTRRDHWIQVFGTLVGVEPTPGESNWGTVTVKLPDDSLVQLKDVVLSRWTHLVGKAISTIARVTAPPEPVALQGVRVVCPGHVERCGMD